MLYIDIDGVFCNSGVYILDRLNKYCSSKKGFVPLGLSDINVYDFGEVFPMTCEEIHDCYHDLINTTIDIPSFFVEPELFLSLYEKEKIINFLTARDISTRDNTLEWLKKNLPEDIEYKVFFEKNKLRFFQNNKKFNPVIVEDRLKTVIDLSDNGFFCYLVNRPWNRNRDTCSNIERVKSLGEAIERYLKNSY